MFYVEGLQLLNEHAFVMLRVKQASQNGLIDHPSSSSSCTDWKSTLL